ncbi:MAG: hypothetical protein LUF90_09330 [Rikenellaceae bacterium]|nr:hypothetical protein [Rikenellaceae bacterium]
MSMIFKLRMLSNEDENFLRDYEVPYDIKLDDLHYFMAEDLGCNKESLASFFLSNKNWEKIQEFTLIDMGIEDETEDGPAPMSSRVIGQLLHKNNDRLLYLFDPFMDRAMYIELIGAEKLNEQFDYPRTLLANGSPPDQFNPDLSPDNKSIFEEVMDDFYDFEGDELYDEDLY